MVKPFVITREKKGVPLLQEIMLREGRVDNHNGFADLPFWHCFPSTSSLVVSTMQKSVSHIKLALCGLGQTPVTWRFTFQCTVLSCKSLSPMLLTISDCSPWIKQTKTLCLRLGLGAWGVGRESRFLPHSATFSNVFF